MEDLTLTKERKDFIEDWEEAFERNNQNSIKIILAINCSEFNSIICNCDCHKKGTSIMHFHPCCNLTDMKYIKEDGRIDLSEVEKIYTDKGYAFRVVV